MCTDPRRRPRRSSHRIDGDILRKVLAAVFTAWGTKHPDVAGIAEVGRHFAPSAEIRVEAAVGVVAREGEARIEGAEDEAGHDDLPIRLDGDPRSRLDVLAEELRRNHPVPVEGRVEAAVGVVAREGENSEEATKARGDDLVVP